MVLTVLHLRNKQGEQYRKTLHYGYDKQQGIDRWMGMKLNGLDPWQVSEYQDAEIAADMYACGFLQPHYPVPVIPDNQTYLARMLGSMSGHEWYRLWAWSHMEWLSSI